MKNPSRHRSLLIIIFGCFLIGTLLRLGTNSPEAFKTPESGSKIAARTSISTAQSATAATAPVASAPKPGSFLFSELSSLGKLHHQVTLDFKPSAWEPDLHTALEIPAEVPLRRLTGIFKMSGGFVAPLIRIDRVYRLALPIPTSKAAITATEEASQPKQASTVFTPPSKDAILIWENAMVADQIMVKAKANVSQVQLEAVLPLTCQITRTLSQNGLFLVTVPEDSLDLAIQSLAKLPEVEFAEPDHLTAGADTSPNDPLVGPNQSTQQWHLGKLMTPLAWDVIHSPKTPADAASTVVAVVDTGIDYTHPDLAANIWTNPGETGNGKETNGIDDDANGMKDDWHGWDFIGQSTVQSTILPDNNPMDDSGHGTHVAGIIGAVGNNALGGSGICWNVKLLPIRIIKKYGTGSYGTYSTAIAALYYLREFNLTRQVAVANHSWGGVGYSLAMLNAINNPLASADPLPTGLTCSFAKDSNKIKVSGTDSMIARIKVGMSISGVGIPTNALVSIISSGNFTLTDFTKAAGTSVALTFANPIRPKAYGCLHVAAAGNNRYNNDRIPMYPASLPSNFMLSVGATDTNDAVALWAGVAGSNYGSETVDIFAPGSNIWSTKLKLAGESTYGYEARNGTSMAAPQVAGAAALLSLWQPNLTEVHRRQIILDTVDVLPVLAGKCASSGRLNVAKMLDKAYQPLLVVSGGSTGASTAATTQALAGGQATFGRVATNGTAAFAIRNGKVYSWGNDLLSSGEQTIPTEMPGLEDIVMITATPTAAAALKDDGTVWTWGSEAGQLGRGASPNMAVPTKIPTLSGVVWVSGCRTESPGYFLAVKLDGTVWGWGFNSFSQLGAGTGDVLVPRQIPGLSGIRQVSAGDSMHSMALKENGTVWCWGKNTKGVLGSPDVDALHATPTQVAGVENAVFVEAGFETSIAVLSDGTLSVWGNGRPVLSGPDVTWSHTPQVANRFSGIAAVSWGNYNVLLLTTDGRVLSTGIYGRDGQIWNGLSENDISYSEVIENADEVFTTVQAGYNFSIGVTGDGAIKTWGSNAGGKLGVGTVSDKRLPSRVAALDGFNQVTCSTNPRSFGLSANCEVYSWGINTTTQLPRLFAPFANELCLRMVTCPHDGGIFPPPFALGLKTNGTVSALDYKADGTLAESTTTYQGLTNVTAIATTATAIFDSADLTRTHSLAVSGGMVKSWGGNERGQLGTGNTVPSLSPVTAQGLQNVVQVACGKGHSLALKNDGTLWSWGRNHKGQLGLGDQVDRLQPQQVTTLTGVVAIACLDGTSWAVKADGRVYAWGNNPDSWVQPNGPAFVISPIQMASITNAVKVCPVSTTRGIYAILNDGKALVWGGATERSYPVALTTASGDTLVTTPRPVIGIFGAVEISGNTYSAFAKTSAGFYAWGAGAEGSLGGGDAWSIVPVTVLGFDGASTTLSSLGTANTADSWYFQNFSTAELVLPSLVSDLADPDGDGIANLMEYALGLDPRTRNRDALPIPREDIITPETESTGAAMLFSLPTVDLNAGQHYLVLTVSRHAGIRQDINYLVEVSDDLVNWRSGDPHTLTVLDTPETLEVYSTTSMTSKPVQYMRLKIQRKNSSAGSGAPSSPPKVPGNP